ncbi:MAG: hypothetical protein K9M36_02600 [Candidatus Pacebacteria bacterium]|nr:hypothetical protein [Candidatus Paceibacterota bacterium]
MEFLRSFRIGPFTIFDFAISYIVMYFIAPYLSKLFALAGIRVNREQWLWLTLPIALAVHLLTKTSTAFTEMTLDPSGGWFAKAIIVIMLFMVYVRRGNRKK